MDSMKGFNSCHSTLLSIRRKMLALTQGAKELSSSQKKRSASIH